MCCFHLHCKQGWMRKGTKDTGIYLALHGRALFQWKWLCPTPRFWKCRIKQCIMSTSVSPHSSDPSLLLHISTLLSDSFRSLTSSSNYHCSHIPPSHLDSLSLSCFAALSPLQILLPSLRAVPLLRAQQPRRVLHVSVPREESTGKPPPLHHGEGGLRELGSKPQRPLSPARLEADGCRLWTEQLTHVTSGWILGFRSEVWTWSLADNQRNTSAAAAADLLCTQLGRARPSTQSPDKVIGV